MSLMSVALQISGGEDMVLWAGKCAHTCTPLMQMDHTCMCSPVARTSGDVRTSLLATSVAWFRMTQGPVVGHDLL